MENKIAKLEQRVEQLEKILRIHNGLLLDVINHIELETRCYYGYYGEAYNDDKGKYHQALFESQKVLEERIVGNYEN